MQNWKAMIIAAAMAACFGAGLRAEEKVKTGTWYERLGGMPAIHVVVDDFTNRILADERINTWFAHVASSSETTQAYKSKLADLICQGTGGPCKYTGPDMVAVHRGRGITEDAFNAVVSDLVASLTKFQVPEKERGQLLAILAAMKPAVVQKEK